MRRYVTKKQSYPVWPATILRDTQEKKRAWRFGPATKWRWQKKRLPTGDYSIRGFEKIIAIERKNSLDELLASLCGKRRDRFKRELKRMLAFPVRLLVVEDDYSRIGEVYDWRDSPVTSAKNTLDFWIAEIAVRYRTPVLFIGSQPDKKLLDVLFEKCYEQALQEKR